MVDHVHDWVAMKRYHVHGINVCQRIKPPDDVLHGASNGILASHSIHRGTCLHAMVYTIEYTTAARAFHDIHHGTPTHITGHMMGCRGR